MNEEQREKLAQALLEESLACAERNDLEDAKDLMQRSVAIKWNHTIEKILNGDKELLKETTKKQFNGNKTDIDFFQLNLCYIINPTTNLKLEFSLTHRNQMSQQYDQKTNFYCMSLVSDLFNYYYDF